jgi:hypothetical protein
MTRSFSAFLAIAALALAAAAPAQEPTLAWSDLHDGGAALTDDGFAVVVDPDGHPILGGVHTPAGGSADILVRKLDRQTGQPLWTFVYQDPDGNDMALADLLLDHRGDLLVAGYLSACDG